MSGRRSMPFRVKLTEDLISIGTREKFAEAGDEVTVVDWEYTSVGTKCWVIDLGDGTTTRISPVATDVI